jgi:hypothetical protein
VTELLVYTGEGLELLNSVADAAAPFHGVTARAHAAWEPLADPDEVGDKAVRAAACVVVIEAARWPSVRAFVTSLTRVEVVDRLGLRAKAPLGAGRDWRLMTWAGGLAVLMHRDALEELGE